ncbi:MAG: glycosyltransferase [Prevotellaceae bacterium]|jgi:GT2 family glycosyltransferase|nr:glycosyltransferase [Prevotellaceae bacterium]
MITASIVTYKTNIEELKKVLTCTADSIVEIIYVIDNSPVDELKIISEYSDKIIYIFNNVNLGYGKAHNIAIRKSIEKQAKYHIVINPDIYFNEGVIETLSEFMDSNIDVGLVMPKVLYANGEIQYLCKLLPTPIDLIGRRFIPFKKYINDRDVRYELRFTDYQTIMEVPSLSGCFMFIRTDILSKTGGFDERYFMYAEDLDLCRKINKIAKNIYFPHVSIYHRYAKESYNNLRLLKYHIISAIKYFNKWGWFFDNERTKVNREIRKVRDYTESKSCTRFKNTDV